MTPSLRRRWTLLALALGALLALAALLVQLAARELRTQVVAALGPQASLDAIALTWRGLELRGLRIAAAPKSGWPASDELRADRVSLLPDPRSLFGGPWRVQRVRVEGGYLSMLRTRDGRLRLLPSLLETRQRDPRGVGDDRAGPRLVIGRVELADSALEFHDASVGTRPHRLRLEQLQASAGPLPLPALDAPVEIELEALLKGVRRDGRLELAGTLTPSSKDARLAARLRGVDLVALQPYLIKAADTGVRSGTLDLALDASVQRQRLRAPGEVTLTGLELAGGSGALASFAGVPRQAVLAALQREGRIRIGFTLEGRLDDPAFSINESLAMRVTSGLAESVGVSVGGVVEGVGGLVRGLFGK